MQRIYPTWVENSEMKHRWRPATYSGSPKNRDLKEGHLTLQILPLIPFPFVHIIPDTLGFRVIIRRGMKLDLWPPWQPLISSTCNQRVEYLIQNMFENLNKISGRGVNWLWFRLLKVLHMILSLQLNSLTANRWWLYSTVRLSNLGGRHDNERYLFFP